MELKQVKSKFLEVFGAENGENEIRSYHSPGRVNLIGEHTDYNGGYVFPCALSFGTYAVARKRNDSIMKFASTNFDLKVEVDLNDNKYVKEHDWTNYTKGVVDQFVKNGSNISGFEVMFSGNIPNGAGLSSSASLELAMSVVLNDLFDLNYSMIDMVKLSQKAENEFVGLNCGIMDQFAVGMGKKDNAMFLNCRNLEYEYAPVVLNGAKIVIANSHKRRGLADSKYNERRSECEKAVEDLKKVMNIECLADVSVEEFEKNKLTIENEICRKRAEHVVYEDDRTLKAVKMLQEGKIDEFGKLMNASHDSLRDLYEVTGLELDTLVEEARKIEGTIGSRMTGAGFGGCTVSIVKDDYIDKFIDEIGKNYKAKTGLTAEFYVAEIGDGAKRID